MDECIIVCYKRGKHHTMYTSICQQHYIIICFIIQVKRSKQIIPIEYYNITRVMRRGFPQRANLILLQGKWFILYRYFITLKNFQNKYQLPIILFKEKPNMNKIYGILL